MTTIRIATRTALSIRSGVIRPLIPSMLIISMKPRKDAARGARRGTKSLDIEKINRPTTECAESSRDRRGRSRRAGAANEMCRGRVHGRPVFYGDLARVLTTLVADHGFVRPEGISLAIDGKTGDAEAYARNLERLGRIVHDRDRRLHAGFAGIVE